MFHVLVAVLLLTGAVMTAAWADLEDSAVPTASSEMEGYPATNLIDGDANMYWQPAAGQGAGSWVQLTWATPQTLNRLQVTEPYGFANITGLSVEAMVDGTWKTLSSAMSGTSTIEVRFAYVTTTAVRLTLTASADYTMGIGELEAINLHGDSIARLATATSSGYWISTAADKFPYLPSLAIDGKWTDARDGWLSENFTPYRHPRWLQLTWPEPQTFNKVVAMVGETGTGSRYPAGYWLQTSNDGYNWTDIALANYVAPPVGGTTVLRTWTLNILLPTSVTTRYLRLRVVKQPNSGQMAIRELEVYNVTAPDWANVSGKVTDSSNSAGIGKAQLQITNGDNVYAIDGDSAGNYAFSIPAGDWTVTVRGPGYTTQDFFVSAAAGENKTGVNFSLNRGAWANFPNVSFTAPSNAQGLLLAGNTVSTRYGYTVTTAGPAGDIRDCIKSSPGYDMAFDLDSNFYRGCFDTAWLTVTYLDTGTSMIALYYYTNAGSTGYGQYAVIPKMNTGQWVTRTITLVQPFFHDAFAPLSGQSGEFFFRTIDTALGDYYANVTISFEPPAGYNQQSASIMFGNPNTENGMSQMMNGATAQGGTGVFDGNIPAYATTIETVAGKSAARTTDEARFVAVDVDATKLGGIRDLWVEVDYLDAGTDILYFYARRYNGTSGYAISVAKSNTNTWKTLKCFIPEAYLGDWYGGDFYVDDVLDGDEWISKISVSTTGNWTPQNLTSVGAARSGAMQGQYVTLTGKVCTNVYNNVCYYIADEDRASAIRVQPMVTSKAPTLWPTAGQRLQVTGTASNNMSLRVIDDATFTVVGTGDPLPPVGMTQATAFGSGAETDAVYARIMGKITAIEIKDSTDTRFTIDDGSGVPTRVVVVNRQNPDTTWAFTPVIGFYITAEGNIGKYVEQGTFIPSVIVTAPEKVTYVAAP